MRTLSRIPTWVLLLTLLFSGVASAGYPVFHHDPQRTGFVPGIGPVESTLRWSNHLGEFIGAPPTVMDGRVYVGVWPDMVFQPGEEYYFYCLDIASSSELWRNPLAPGLGTVSGAAISGDRVFVGCMDGKLYCINKKTGSTIWSVQVDVGNADGNWYGLASSPVVENGMIYVTSLTNGTLHAITTEGVEAWNITTGGKTFAYSSPAVDGGRVYFAGNTGTHALYCIDAGTHAEVWHTPVADEIKSCPVIAGESIYITTATTLTALNRGTGAVRWSQPISASWGTPAIAGISVYVGTRADSTLHCYDSATGAERWNFTANGKIDTSPVVAANAVYFASNTAAGTIYALDPAGHELWHYTTTNYVMSPPAVADGALLIGSDEGTLYAFGTALKQVQGGGGLPADHDRDTLYEDVNGNGRADFADVVLYFNQMTWIAANEPLAAFDYNGNGRIDFADVVWLFNSL